MINYRSTENTVTNDGFSSVLKETEEYFAKNQCHIIGESFKTILTENAYFEEYSRRLSEGLNANDAKDFVQLLENTRLDVLTEGSLAGLQDLSSLAMPTIRKMWAKLALKNAIPTQPVKKPRFAISYTKAYLIDGNGDKHELPAGLNKDTGGSLVSLKKLDTTPIAIPATDTDLLGPVSASTELGDTIDKNFRISSVNMTVTLADDTTTEDYDVDVNIIADIRSGLFGTVSVTDSEDTVHTDQVLGHVDFKKGTITITSVAGLVNTVVVDGALTSEKNNRGESIEFDIDSKDVTIGAGEHLNASLPLEWLQDTKALYNIDGATELVDLMSKVMGQKIDLEIFDFLVDSSNKVSQAKGADAYDYTFDVKPPAAFDKGRIAWREEIKAVIQHGANRMKRDSNISGGKFVLVGSPIDLEIIPNVDWTFSSSQEQGGVNVPYSLGAMAGHNRFDLVSSDLIPDGEIYMVFLPKSSKLMTYKYFPYSYNVVKGGGYRDPNAPMVPSIMMTKRSAMEEFLPLIGKITIANNDGSTAY